MSLIDTSFINLVYNYVIRGGVPDALKENQQVILLKDNESLELGGVYQEHSGFLCTMATELSSTSGEYARGYRFVGDNGVYYLFNGQTYLGMTSPNDVHSRVFETS